MAACGTGAVGRRRLFWATQPDACGEDQDCFQDCGRPGFKVETTDEGLTFSTDEWLRGLIINMLMTDGRRPASACGYSPGGRGGHWSESYMGSNAGVGTLLRTVEPGGSVVELRALLAAHAQSTLGRLVARGVAVSTNTTAEYLGNGRFRLIIEVIGINNEISRIGLSGDRLANGWVWQ